MAAQLAPTSVFRYEQAFDIVEQEDGGIIDVPQIGAYRAHKPIPAHVFEAERLRAVCGREETGFIDLDLSQVLGTAYPCTTPLLLCRYLVLRAGDAYAHALQATGEVFYVIRGSGASESAGRRIDWSAGDIFVFPGGARTSHKAVGGDALLFVATDEPLLRYLRVSAPAAAESPVAAARFSARQIDERLASIYAKVDPHDGPGKAAIFYTRPMAHTRAMLPAMNVGMNSLEPGGSQAPHQHSAVAVTLAIQSRGVHSTVDGQRVDWPESGAFITPPGLPHAHHNHGPAEMRAFVVQDGGIHNYCRTGNFRRMPAA